MDIPTFNTLLQEIEVLLEAFDPSTVVYLNDQGSWVREPTSLRHRISNELWYRIWEVEQKKDLRNQIKNIINPFISHEQFCDIANKIYGREYSERKKASDLVVIFEFIYRLIEYTVMKMNSEVYVADWDYKGNQRRLEYERKMQEFLKNMRTFLDVDEELNALMKLIGLFGKEDESLFSGVCSIIAAEENVRQWLSDLLSQFKTAKKEDEIYTIMSEQIGLEIGAVTDVPQALVRPCIEILRDPNIDISSGLQYRASSILGALKDPRATETLTFVLMSCDRQYTNIRSNVIYALGMLRQRTSLKHLVNILEGPDYVDVYLSSGTTSYAQPLRWEKNEAIWALGKLGAHALEALPVLTKFVNSTDNEIKISLAWAMGMIGSKQKEKYGGIDAAIIIALMNMLTTRNSKLFEEITFGLRSLNLPDFLHSLYLHNIMTIPILALKPSSIGLYELSETIFHLISIKKPVIMAVTGDSGTGKTYFCEAIKNGFGDLSKDEIVYLMRDNPAHMYVFNRMLGIKLLRDYIDPQYYEDYPLTEGEDDPDVFFDNFIKKHENKKLIILDGWMDEVYFYHVLKVFYAKGYLDCMVNFRTTFSTKRFNLEEREGVLERVKNCLSYIEKPIIEDTEFYRNGDVLVYNLDNSVASRLSQQEMLEIFSRRKVETWGDYIRIGKFEKDVKKLHMSEERLVSSVEKYSPQMQYFSLKDSTPFTPDEASFSRVLNEDIERESNLLQVIKLSTIEINRITFHTLGQIAYCGFDGSVGILSGLNERIFYTQPHKEKARGVCTIGGDICSIDAEGSLQITSFSNNTITRIGRSDSPACVIASDRTSYIVTGYADGTVRLWDLQSKEMKVLRGHSSAVVATTISRDGKIVTGSEDGELRIWDVDEDIVTIVHGHKAPINALSLYPDGRIVIGLGSNKSEQAGAIKIIDTESNLCEKLNIHEHGSVTVLHVYFDGRIIAGIAARDMSSGTGMLVMVDLRSNVHQYKIIGKHGFEIRDCITMGPRIITGGSENDNEHTLRIWGTELYVKMEHDKLKFMLDTKSKPPYYSTIF